LGAWARRREYETALRAVTIDAAGILGLAGRLGSLEPGKDADVVVLSGHPLDIRTRVEKVFVNGRLVYAGR
ncbi:MAG: amidohydrolase family protein, partial [Firmicutes bacterium]|nr:amidohydrolase family protein [Bacillota bacterium]